MFSVQQKRDIAEKVQRILRETAHPELPDGEITFLLHVDGAAAWSCADIRNNGSVTSPGVNPWNELHSASPQVNQVELCECGHKPLYHRDTTGECVAIADAFGQCDCKSFEPVGAEVDTRIEEKS